MDLKFRRGMGTTAIPLTSGDSGWFRGLSPWKMMDTTDMSLLLNLILSPNSIFTWSFFENDICPNMFLIFLLTSNTCSNVIFRAPFRFILIFANFSQWPNLLASNTFSIGNESISPPNEFVKQQCLPWSLVSSSFSHLWYFLPSVSQSIPCSVFNISEIFVFESSTSPIFSSSSSSSSSSPSFQLVFVSNGIKLSLYFIPLHHSSFQVL
jgi:hypothetical protein